MDLVKIYQDAYTLLPRIDNIFENEIFPTLKISNDDQHDKDNYLFHRQVAAIAYHNLHFAKTPV